MAWAQDICRTVFPQWDWPTPLCWQKGPTVDPISQGILAGEIQKSLWNILLQEVRFHPPPFFFSLQEEP